MSIRIDKEFESLIPPLTDEEFKQLEENIVRDGIRDPLVVWHVPNGDDILIDGHNRWKIAAKHAGIPFDIKRMTFDLRDDVKAWIIQNQLGRRNVNDFVRSELALQLKPLLAAQAKKRQSQAGKGEDVQKSAQARTRSELAKVAGVSHDTIRKVEKIKEMGTQKQIQQARSGEKSINRVFNEVMDKEKSRLPSAKEYAEQAKDRHDSIKDKPVVSIKEAKNDEKDKAIIEAEVIRSFKNTAAKVNNIYVLVDAGEIAVDVLSKEGRTTVLALLEQIRKSTYGIAQYIKKE